MNERPRPGDRVQTPLGKGVVREARRNGRLLVEVNGRAIVVEERAVLLDIPKATHGGRRDDRGGSSPPPDRDAAPASRDVDLHGLTVEEALARVEQALNDALLDDVPQLRLIHGKSGGRIRAALHRRLKEIPAVRAFRVDPRNDGVTIATL